MWVSASACFATSIDARPRALCKCQGTSLRLALSSRATGVAWGNRCGHRSKWQRNLRCVGVWVDLARRSGCIPPLPLHTALTAMFGLNGGHAAYRRANEHRCPPGGRMLATRTRAPAWNNGARSALLSYALMSLRLRRSDLQLSRLPPASPPRVVGAHLVVVRRTGWPPNCGVPSRRRHPCESLSPRWGENVASLELRSFPMQSGSLWEPDEVGSGTQIYGPRDPANYRCSWASAERGRLGTSSGWSGQGPFNAAHRAKVGMGRADFTNYICWGLCKFFMRGWKLHNDDPRGVFSGTRCFGVQGTPPLRRCWSTRGLRRNPAGLQIVDALPPDMLRQAGARKHHASPRQPEQESHGAHQAGNGRAMRAAGD